uniref:Uncharacterized protein n=1 Tax=Timema genevievae TaxID=629358 RepID=A0A7R9K534_TIMGE|nr:unnamed protein product [Timema genevievae]
MGWYIVLSALVAAYVLDSGTPVDGGKLPDAQLTGDKYTTRYDNIDVNAILKSERLLNNYVKCILKDERCTPDGKLLQGGSTVRVVTISPTRALVTPMLPRVSEVIPEALGNECAKCNEIQRKKVGEVLGYLLQERRDIWDQLLLKFDTDGSFRKKYGYDEEDEDYEEEEVEETKTR